MIKKKPWKHPPPIKWYANSNKPVEKGTQVGQKFLYGE
jgi:hypothetical protein